MSTVLEQIEQQIAKLSSKAVKKNTGNIRSVADGVAKIEGLSDVMYNEMVQFPGGAIGIALNLEEDEVGCVVLGDISKLREGDEVQTRGRSPRRNFIRSKKSRPASLSANPFRSRSSPASWRSIP
jgi:F-type H+-transporting ATPase subunit alpha